VSALQNTGAKPRDSPPLPPNDSRGPEFLPSVSNGHAESRLAPAAIMCRSSGYGSCLYAAQELPTGCGGRGGGRALVPNMLSSPPRGGRLAGAEHQVVWLASTVCSVWEEGRRRHAVGWRPASRSNPPRAGQSVPGYLLRPFDGCNQRAAHICRVDMCDLRPPSHVSSPELRHHLTVKWAAESPGDFCNIPTIGAFFSE